MPKNPLELVKYPLCPAENLKKGGFTLAELLVAVVAASMISLAALQLYGAYHSLYLHLYGDYQKETAELLDGIRRINPYCFGARIKR